MQALHDFIERGSAGLRTAVIAGGFAAVVALVVSSSDPAMVALPVHPAWLLTLVLAARYGASGLLSVVGVVIGVSAANLLAGCAPFAMADRLQRPGDLAALSTAALLAWIGDLHKAREQRLERNMHEADERTARAMADAGELAEAALALRDRQDHAQTSLSFLVDIAARLDSADPTAAAQAALELALARTGARAGLVQVIDGPRLRTLATRGPWSAEHVEPPVLFRDLVVSAAIEREKTVAAHEVDGVRPADSDLAAPLVGDDGRVRGVLALRGLPYPALLGPGREDATAIARWLSRALLAAVVDVVGVAGRGEPFVAQDDR